VSAARLLGANAYPSGWAESRLLDLLREPLRNGHSALASNNGSGIRTLTLTAVTKGEFSVANTKLTIAVPEKVSDLWLEPYDILIERSNTPELVGTARLYKGLRDFAIFPDLVIRIRLSNRVSPELLEAFLHSPRARSYFRRAAQGNAGTMPKISQGTIENLLVLVPPRAEQARIVDAIESYFTRLDDAVATLERVDRSLKRYRASVLKAAVAGRLVPTEAVLAKQEGRSYEPGSVLLERILTERRRRWFESGKKGKYEEPAPPDTTNLPDLPEGWCWATVEQVCSQIVDCPHSTPKWTNEGHICVRTTEFLPGRLVLDGVRLVSQATYEDRIQRLRPETGDILYSREGGILGIACQVPQGVELCLGQRMMLMRSARQTSARYLMHVLNSPPMQTRVHELTGGSASPHLNVGDIKDFPIPFPSETEALRISDAIDDILSVVDSTDADVAVNMSRAVRLRQSILKWAFEGKLVDQDPKDEPASVLLERIKAEREASKPTKATGPQRVVRKKQVRA
jgi:type I restriction enzyme S subunit